MKYTVETGPGAMFYIRSFSKIGSAIQKFMREGVAHTSRHTARMVIT
jgi:hypothetical protein